MFMCLFLPDFQATSGNLREFSRAISGKLLGPFSGDFIDTEYDRAKVPPYNGNDPRPPLVV